jgi:hypothetical protein
VSLGPDFLQGDSQAFQDPGGDAFTFSKQSYQQMLSANIGMVHAAGFVYGQLYYLLGSRSKTNFALSGFFAPPDNKFYC